MLYLDAVEEFLLEKSLSCRERTVDYYRERLDYFHRATGVEHVTDIDTRTVAEYRKGIAHLSPRTVHNYLLAVKTFCGWLVRRGLLRQNPVPKLSRASRTHGKPSGLSDAQVKACLAVAKRSRFPERNVALLYLLLDTGIRAGELCGLNLEDIDHEGRTIRVDGKTGERVVPVSSRTLRALRRYVASHRVAGVRERALFTTQEGVRITPNFLTTLLKRIAQRAGIPNDVKTGPHTYRHTFALGYIRNGGDPFSLQRILGHTTMDMVSVYLRMEGTALSEAHGKFSPLSRLAA